MLTQHLSTRIIHNPKRERGTGKKRERGTGKKRERGTGKESLAHVAGYEKHSAFDGISQLLAPQHIAPIIGNPMNNPR